MQMPDCLPGVSLYSADASRIAASSAVELGSPQVRATLRRHRRGACARSRLLGLVEAIGSPSAITIGDLYETASNRNQHDVAEMLIDRKTRPKLPHVLDRIGYVAVPNPDAPSAGKWKVGDRYVPIYALKSLSRGHQIDAAKTRAKRGA